MDFGGVVEADNAKGYGMEKVGGAGGLVFCNLHAWGSCLTETVI